MAAIREAGFRAIIRNRPDGEGADQPNFEEIEAAARLSGNGPGLPAVLPAVLSPAMLRKLTGRITLFLFDIESCHRRRSFT